jgi:hypothetical protein
VEASIRQRIPPIMRAYFRGTDAERLDIKVSEGHSAVDLVERCFPHTLAMLTLPLSTPRTRSKASRPTRMLPGLRSYSTGTLLARPCVQ